MVSVQYPMIDTIFFTHLNFTGHYFKYFPLRRQPGNGREGIFIRCIVGYDLAIDVHIEKKNLLGCSSSR
jgi:hypothetical protein